MVLPRVVRLRSRSLWREPSLLRAALAARVRRPRGPVTARARNKNVTDHVTKMIGSSCGRKMHAKARRVPGPATRSWPRLTGPGLQAYRLGK